MFGTKVVEDIETYFMFKKLFFCLENRDVYKITEKYGRSRQAVCDNTVLRRKDALWMQDN